MPTKALSRMMFFSLSSCSICKAAALRAVMSIIKPLMVVGWPFSVWTDTMSCSQIVRPSFVMNRYSKSWGSARRVQLAQ